MQWRQLSSGVRKPVFGINLALGALVIVGGGWAYQTVWSQPAAASTTGASKADYVAASMRDVTATVSSTGTVASSDVITANFGTNSTVTHIYVKLGDHVTKGEVLARVDPTSADEQLQTAQDNLTAADDSLARAKTSKDTTSIDTAQSQVDSATDSVTSAESAVTGTVLKAPIAGTIIAQNGVVGASSGSSSSSSASSGGGGGGGGSNTGSNTSSSSSTTSSATSSSGFMKIADLTKMEIDTDFSETDVAKLTIGQAATVTWNALTGATATGTVASIDPTATTSNNVVSYGVVVNLTTLPTGIRIGQSTNVVVTTASASNVLAVLTSTVTTTGGASTVLLQGQTIRTRVQIGIKGDTYTQIVSGLKVGDEVQLPAASTSGTSTTITNPFGGGGLGGFGGGGFGGGGGGFGGGGRG